MEPAELADPAEDVEQLSAVVVQGCHRRRHAERLDDIHKTERSLPFTFVTMLLHSQVERGASATGWSTGILRTYEPIIATEARNRQVEYLFKWCFRPRASPNQADRKHVASIP